jgi:hypothetical protein
VPEEVAASALDERWAIAYDHELNLSAEHVNIVSLDVADQGSVLVYDCHEGCR